MFESNENTVTLLGRTAKDRMCAYRRLKIFAAAVLVGYSVAAMIIKVALPYGREVFPLFSWSLYSTVPRDDANYGLRILAIKGQTLDAPLFFEQARRIFPYANSRQVFMILQFLGKEMDSTRNNTEAFREYRRLLEKHHLRGQGVIRYEIVHRTFHTLTRWKTGEIKTIRKVGTTFSTEAET